MNELPVVERPPMACADRKRIRAPSVVGRTSKRSAIVLTPGWPEGIDARFFFSKPDLSELPSAYKDAESVLAQIKKYDLASIVDSVQPYGSIMAGDWAADAPWRKKKTASGGPSPA